jgi:hypothetical protein
MKAAFELAQIIRKYGDDFVRDTKPIYHHQKTLGAIKICRTAELGGHVDRCSDCGHERIAYNSCRNRHCPKCQTTNKERWILDRKEDLLPCSYFHVVFTIPQELNWYCLHYPVALYNILFKASKETLFSFGYDPKHLGAQMGAISVLHTWGQNLSLHPHVHMIVPGGGFGKDGTWKNARSDGNFLFPLKAMAQVYRAKFMELFRMYLKSIKMSFNNGIRQQLYSKNWVIYAKKPFAGPDDVIEYLGRYTHKIAISNHRIKSIDNGKIKFSYKDYAHGSVTKEMTLDVNEFLRRFCMHILPSRFVKMRHYGFLGNRGKQKLKIYQMILGKIPEPKQKITYKEISKNQLSFDIEHCPWCKTGRMITVLHFAANAPPMLTINKKTLKNDIN